MALISQHLSPGLTKQVNAGRTIIRQDWFRSLGWGRRGNGWTVFLLPTVAVGAMVAWQGPNLLQGKLPKDLDLMAGLGAGTLTLFLVYYALAHLVNTTTLEFGGGDLRLHYGPLPLPGRGGSGSIAEADIVKVICIEYDREGAASPAYDLAVATRDGRREVLFHRLRRHDQVSHLVREICSRLKITDALERR